MTPLAPPESWRSYDALKAELQKNKDSRSFSITDESGNSPLQLLEYLGRGGSKEAWKIDDCRALLLPNMSVDSIQNISRSWARIVSEEVKMSQILTKLGLLSPLSKQVSITLEDQALTAIPAYTSKSFESLKEEGCFVIDIKNEKSSTWKFEQHHLFQSNEERLIEGNWDLAFKSLLTDIKTICSFNIGVEGDALNMAIVKNQTGKYQVRYFGFDFSSKHGRIQMPNIESATFPIDKDKAYDLLRTIISTIFSYEFSDLEYKQANSDQIRSLRDKLLQKYTDLCQK